MHDLGIKLSQMAENTDHIKIKFEKINSYDR